MVVLRITSLLVVLLAACAASRKPVAVTCVDSEGAPVTGANVTFHANDVDGSTVVLAQDAERIGCTTIRAEDREIPACVSMRPRATIRGRVYPPAGHAAPVRVAVVCMWSAYRPRGADHSESHGFGRAWSPASHAWLPAIDALDTTAAPDGTFTLVVAAGTAPIVALTSPGLTMAQRWVPPGSDDMKVELLPETKFAITVIGADGAPIDGATVSLLPFEQANDMFFRFDHLVILDQTTGSDGRVSFDGLPHDYYSARVRVPGLPLHIADVVVAEEDQHMTLRVDSGVLVRGCVRDDVGRGVGAVTVVAMGDVLRTRTDANGNYELRVPRCETFMRLSDVPPGFSDTTGLHEVDLTMAASGVHVLDFVLRRR